MENTWKEVHQSIHRHGKMHGRGKRVSHMNSCAAKPVSFTILAAIIFLLYHLDEVRKFPLLTGEEVPARNMELGKFPPLESGKIPAGDMELRKFPPLEGLWRWALFLSI
jgi:hypothetical protein